MDIRSVHNGILQAAARSGLDTRTVQVFPFSGHDPIPPMNHVAIHFPGGSASGTYEAIKDAVAAAQSFAELKRICEERSLLNAPES